MRLFFFNRKSIALMIQMAYNPPQLNRDSNVLGENRQMIHQRRER
jgi:hypothetical protein